MSFKSEDAVATDPAVTANTAKVTNATHTGDVVGATVLTIDANKVLNTMLADVATATIKGRVTAATGDPEDLTGTQATTLLDLFSPTLQGVVPLSGGGTTAFLRADGTWVVPAGTGESNTGSNVNVGGVGVFKQKAGVDLEFRGINAATAKVTVVLDAGNNEIDLDVADASLTQAGAIELATQVEVDTGTDTTRAIVPATLAGSTLAGDVTTNNAKITNATHTGDVTGATVLTIAADAVTNVKLANVATATFKGRVTAATGDPEDLTGTQATTLLDPFTTALQGVVPASGGVATDFLSADGTWVVPAGTATLQTAYDAGDTITTAGVTPITLNLTSGGLVVQGGGDVAFGSVTEVGVFSAFSGGSFTLLGRDTALVDMQANDAANKTLTISASNAGAGSGSLNLNVDDLTTFRTALGEANPGWTFSQNGIGGESADLFIGASSPSGTVTGQAASLFLRDTGATGELWINTSVGAGTSWTQLAAGGEANTASNVNVGGVGVFKQKTGVDLEFRGINAASAKATVVLDAGNNEIDIDVADASLTQAGAIELATQAEVDAGASAVLAVTPATLAASTTVILSGQVAGGELSGTYPNPTVNDGADATAIHDNVAGEIAAIAVKGVPVGADFLIIEDSAAANAKKHVLISSLPGGGGGLTSIDTGNTLWVDAVFGNDGTALSDRQDLPWLTVGAALTAAVSGDTVRIRTGTYTESGLTIGAGVAVVGDGLLNTIVGDAAATADIFALGAGSLLQDMRITLPAPVPASPIYAGVKHIAGTGTVYNLDLRGDGATGKGTGLYKTGTGKIVGGNIRCEGGGMAALIRVDAAVLALDAVHVPNSAGTIDDVILTQGTGRFQGQGVNIGSFGAVDCLHVEGTSTAIIYSPNWANAAIGGHIAADGVTVVIIGGKVDATVATLLVDPALAGTGSVLTVTGTDIQPLFSFPSAALDTMELSAQFHQNKTSTRNAESRVLGSALVTGFPEIGSSFMVGHGSAYSDGIKVVTSDSTATSTTLGGNLTDVTAAAQSRSGSTVTYQGVAANHCIYVASTRIPPAGGNLKHWGLFIDQTGRGIGGSYVAEIWDGAAWVEIGVMASSQEAIHRYADTLFIRPLAPATNSKEFIQYGIDTVTTQATIAVDGVTAYWTRFRVATLLTTAPIFERIWLLAPHTMFNHLGLRRALGLAAWRTTLVSAGNVFGETGTVVAANFAVGSGVSPLTWTHNSPNSLLNSSGDAVYAQFALPDGICTAFPLSIRVVFSFDPGGTLTSPVIGFVSAIPVAAAFNLVADPAGGLVPLPRTIANTETTIAKAATSFTFDSSLIGTVWPADTFFKGTFGPFPIDAYYSDDVMLIRLELNNDGAPNQDVAIIAMIVEGVQFTDGETL